MGEAEVIRCAGIDAALYLKILRMGEARLPAVGAPAAVQGCREASRPQAAVLSSLSGRGRVQLCWRLGRCLQVVLASSPASGFRRGGTVMPTPLASAAVPAVVQHRPPGPQKA